MIPPSALVTVPLPVPAFATVRVNRTGIATENSDVLKRFTESAGELGSAVVFVAVAVMTFSLGTATLNIAENDPTPEPSVVTLVAPINVCPSAAPPSGSGLLEKNSTRKVVMGEAL